MRDKLHGNDKNIMATLTSSHNRTIVLLSVRKRKKGADMRLLRLAVENQRWDLAAYTIVLATARLLKGVERSYGGKSRAKKGKGEQTG